jgi:hypothetical protein
VQREVRIQTLLDQQLQDFSELNIDCATGCKVDFDGLESESG